MKNGKKLILFFRLSWKTVPAYIILLMIGTLTSGAQIVLNVVLPKYLIDELTGEQDIRQLFLFGGLIIGFNLLFAWVLRYLKRFTDVQNGYVNQKMDQFLGDKIMQLEYEKLENPYYLDLKERAAFALENQQALLNLIIQITDLLKNGVTLLSLTVILLTLSPLLVAVLLLLVGVMLLLQKRFSVYQKQIFDSILPVNRRYGYYVNLTFHGDLQKDIRLYDMADMLGARVTEYNQEILRTFDASSKKKGFYRGLYSIINDLRAAIAYGYVGLRVITSWFGAPISFGSFTMYVNAAVQFSSGITKMGESVIQTGRFLEYLDPFLELISLPDVQNEETGLLFEGPVEKIEFEQVDFSYPGSKEKVLHHVSFTVEKGEKISIVGLNGAGKTTLIKLLCRLYRPTNGRILVNGHDIFQYDYHSYIKQLAAVFQDYRLFAFSIGENISCCGQIQDNEQIRLLADQAGLTGKLGQLPNGLHTLLGKAYDEEGTDLSGGQKQKIAIARALYKNASLIILDEPTSALDPLAEAEIYENFNQLAGGKTALYISHRMSSSVFCDKILIIDKGAVTDFASHEQLMKQPDSLYYRLFTAQAENYGT